jgi:cbb3-type cytochrome oxidase subunit 1
LLYLLGMLIMAYNLGRTILGKSTADSPAVATAS